jgi:dipeptidyl aminopeptidase/acylaminoacyl peptidase
VECTAINRNGTRVVAGLSDGTLATWGAQSGRSTARVRAAANAVTAVDFNAREDAVVSGAKDGSLGVWKVDESTPFAHFQTHGEATSAAFSPDGKRLAVASRDRTLAVLEGATGVAVSRSMEREITCVTFSPDGEYLAYGAADGSVRVLEGASGKMLALLAAGWGVWRGVRAGAERARFNWSEARGALWEAKWEVALPAIVLAGLFGGLGTLVEAGAITVLYSPAVEVLVYRELSLRRDYAAVATECVTVIGGVLIILGSRSA